MGLAGIIRKLDDAWYSYRFPTYVIELKEDSETYLVRKALWQALEGESVFVVKIFVLSVNRQGVVFLWPIRPPGPDGKLDGYNQSALDAADVARDTWIRLQANRSLGAYETIVAENLEREPVWPEESFESLLNIAFKGKFINSIEHPVLKNLREAA